MQNGKWLDDDRALLRRLFAGLRKDGFRARMNFTCCNTCGSYEISENPPVAGMAPYVFYHHQAAEALDDGYGLYLNYGYTSQVLKDMPDEFVDMATTWIARIICRKAMKLGLGVDWNGSAATKIMVYPKRWEVSDAA